MSQILLNIEKEAAVKENTKNYSFHLYQLCIDERIFSVLCLFCGSLEFNLTRQSRCILSFMFAVLPAELKHLLTLALRIVNRNIIYCKPWLVKDFVFLTLFVNIIFKTNKLY